MWLRDGYGVWHYRLSTGEPMCLLGFDIMKTEARLPVGQQPCSLCAQELANGAESVVVTWEGCPEAAEDRLRQAFAEIEELPGTLLEGPSLIEELGAWWNDLD